MGKVIYRFNSWQLAGGDIKTKQITSSQQNRMVNFGMTIRRAREDQQVSLNQLARWADVDSAYLSRIETGKVPASIGTIGALADLLGISFYDLLVVAGRVNDDRMPADERKWLKTRIDQGRLLIAIEERKYGIRGQYYKYFAEEPTNEILPKKWFSDYYLETLAVNLLERVRKHTQWSFGLPVPIKKIATVYFPLEVVPINLGEYPKLRAFLDKTKIYVDIHKCGGPNSVNFVVAHELSHWLLQKYENNWLTVAIHKSPSQHKAMEATVNRLAANLLMPRIELLNLSEVYDPEDPSARARLAALFKVPLSSMDFRLLNIGLVDKDTLYAQSLRNRGNRVQ